MYATSRRVASRDGKRSKSDREHRTGKQVFRRDSIDQTRHRLRSQSLPLTNYLRGFNPSLALSSFCSRMSSSSLSFFFCFFFFLKQILLKSKNKKQVGNLLRRVVVIVIRAFVSFM